MPLTNGSMMLDKITEKPFPVVANFYMFNVTNPEEARKGAKPILKEVGPFGLNILRQFSELEFLDDETKLKYCEKRYYVLDEKRSKVDLNTKVTFVNMPWITIIHMMMQLKDQLWGFETSIAKLFIDEKGYFYDGSSDLFFTASVKEFLFDGIEMVMLKKLLEMMELMPDFPIPLPPELKSPKFAMFLGVSAILVVQLLSPLTFFSSTNLSCANAVYKYGIGPILLTTFTLQRL